VSGYPDRDLWAALADEALGFEPVAGDRVFNGLTVSRDGAMMTPQRCRSHIGGPVLYEFAHSAELLSLVRRGCELPNLVPARYGYKYYGPGDFMGLHRDQARCSVTFTFGLSGNLGTMNWAPELREMSTPDLAELVKERGYFPEIGSEVEVATYGLTGFDGYNIPHWRRPFEHELGILGTVCFFDL
jgi:hypothetical protein